MNTMIKVGPKRIVAMRYIMKNPEGEILADTMKSEPVRFLHGSGEILPGLEGVLTGLKIGDQKSFSIAPDISPTLNRTYYFDVIIDDIQWATEAELKGDVTSVADQDDCGPDCGC